MSIFAIRDALVQLLATANTAHAFPMTIGQIDARWAPTWQLSDIAALRVGVIARTETRTRLTRSGDDLGPTVDVALMHHLPATVDIDSTAALDGYATMAQALAEVIAGSPLPGLPDVRLASLVHEPLIDADKLVQHRCIFSLITTTWRYLAAVRVTP